MIEFAFTAVVVTLATWAVVDIYFYCALLDVVRRRAADLARSPIRWKSIPGYGLNCPYCLGHWVAAGLVLAVMFLPTSFGGNISSLDAVFLATVAARLSTMLRENVLRPITDDFTAAHPSDDPELPGS